MKPITHAPAGAVKFGELRAANPAEKKQLQEALQQRQIELHPGAEMIVHEVDDSIFEGYHYVQRLTQGLKQFGNILKAPEKAYHSLQLTRYEAPEVLTSDMKKLLKRGKYQPIRGQDGQDVFHAITDQENFKGESHMFQSSPTELIQLKKFTLKPAFITDLCEGWNKFIALVAKSSAAHRPEAPQTVA